MWMMKINGYLRQGLAPELPGIFAAFRGFIQAVWQGTTRVPGCLSKFRWELHCRFIRRPHPFRAPANLPSPIAESWILDFGSSCCAFSFSWQAKTLHAFRASNWLESPSTGTKIAAACLKPGQQQSRQAADLPSSLPTRSKKKKKG